MYKDLEFFSQWVYVSIIFFNSNSNSKGLGLNKYFITFLTDYALSACPDSFSNHSNMNWSIAVSPRCCDIFAANHIVVMILQTVSLLTCICHIHVARYRELLSERGWCCGSILWHKTVDLICCIVDWRDCPLITCFHYNKNTREIVTSIHTRKCVHCHAFHCSSDGLCLSSLPYCHY